MADMFENRRYRRWLFTSRWAFHVGLLALALEASLWAARTARPVMVLAGVVTVVAAVTTITAILSVHHMDCPTTERLAFTRLTWTLLLLLSATLLGAGLARPEHWYVALFGCVTAVITWLAYTQVRRLRLEYGQSQIAQSAVHHDEGM